MRGTKESLFASIRWLRVVKQAGRAVLEAKGSGKIQQRLAEGLAAYVHC